MRLRRSSAALREPVALVVNAAARTGRDAFETARKTLESLGVQVALARAVEEPGAFRSEVASAVAGGLRVVVVGGGDGSLSAAANAVADLPVALAVLPLGTGNDFARNLKVPTDLARACAVVAAGHRRRVDVGRVNGLRFLNAISLGASTGIAARLTPALKKRAGPLAYALAAAPEIASGKRFRLVVRPDDERSRLVEALQVVVGNGRYHGAGKLVSRHARLTSGRLHAYFLVSTSSGASLPAKTRDAWALARYALLLRRGQHHEHPQTLHLSCSRLFLAADPSQEVNVDGEILARTPVVVDVLPRALEVIAPRGRRRRGEMPSRPQLVVDANRGLKAPGYLHEGH